MIVIKHSAIEQLRSLMASRGCSIGILVYGERLVLLHDSLEELNGESIRTVGEAKLPEALLPPADDRWKGNRALELESQVQQWLEGLRVSLNIKDLP